MKPTDLDMVLSRVYHATNALPDDVIDGARKELAALRSVSAAARRIAQQLDATNGDVTSVWQRDFDELRFRASTLDALTGAQQEKK